MKETCLSRVMLVEDEPIVALDLENTLLSAGYFVVGPAATVDSALVLLDKFQPNAVIMDLKLRGEMAGRLADAFAAAGVPFGFITGQGVDVIPPAYRDRPRLAKPYTHEAVLRMVRGLLEDQAAGVATPMAPRIRTRA